ncbi:hypothetical protein B0H17DRAFT_1094263 [Mycena rosella]|uniref:F-box domain-containing protein n=1 Tax=Mycena rosella TaxID=1033263 RepID=A0AAD7G6V4_MYCRO|nr:hypothetical protein B0H17DRAFT_1094263 [Mycena rosella]
MSESPPSLLSLPNELLVAIIAVGQEARLPDDDFKPEWTMSRVSSRLRALTIGAPELWTLVEIALHAGFGRAVEKSKLYLERSQRCKVWAAVRGQPMHQFSWSDPRVEKRLVAERLGHILPHTHRIWRLDIIAESVSMNAIGAMFRDAAAPSLEHLQIVPPPNFRRDRSHAVLEIFTAGAPPALAVLKLSGFMLVFPTPQWTASLVRLEMQRGGGIVWVDEESFTATTTPWPSLDFLHIDTSLLYSLTIPSLRSLHAPALVELTIHHGHGAVFDATALPTIFVKFPALSSLSFVSTGCNCEEGMPPMHLPSQFPPLHLFPALSSLTLINQCPTITTNMLEHFLGPAPLLDTVTVCPPKDTIENVYTALQAVICSKRGSAQAIPKFRFPRARFEQSYWTANGVGVELFDATEAA